MKIVPQPSSDQRSAMKRGFTLIELLIVIAIVSLLAAILFPVFGRARENARRASCQSNLKQLALGIVQYTQDWDENMPCDGQGGLRGYGGKIYPYVKSAAVFVCPSDDTITTFAGNKVSYAGNSNIGTLYGAGQGNNAPALISAYAQPSRTVVFSEVTNYYATTLSNPKEGNSPATDGTGKPQPNYGSTGAEANATHNALGGSLGRGVGAWDDAEGRHFGGSNIAFLDGHVKSLRGDSVSTGRTQQKAECNQDATPAVTGCAPTGKAQAAGTTGFASGALPAATFGVF